MTLVRVEKNQLLSALEYSLISAKFFIPNMVVVFYPHSIQPA